MVERWLLEERERRRVLWFLEREELAEPREKKEKKRKRADDAEIG